MTRTLLTGNAGANRFFASYTQTGSALEIGDKIFVASGNFSGKYFSNISVIKLERSE